MHNGRSILTKRYVLAIIVGVAVLCVASWLLAFLSYFVSYKLDNNAIDRLMALITFLLSGAFGIACAIFVFRRYKPSPLE